MTRISKAAVSSDTDTDVVGVTVCVRVLLHAPARTTETTGGGLMRRIQSAQLHAGLLCHVSVHGLDAVKGTVHSKF